MATTFNSAVVEDLQQVILRLCSVSLATCPVLLYQYQSTVMRLWSLAPRTYSSKPESCKIQEISVGIPDGEVAKEIGHILVVLAASM